MAPVVDANIFMRGKKKPFESAVTVPGVMEELKSESSRLSFDIEDISVKEPGSSSLEKVRQKSREINSPTSNVDEKLLALALEKDEKLITDDKALQNLALHLGIRFESYMQDEIEEKREWKKVCDNCGRKVSGDRCSTCGSNSIRRKQG